MKITVTLSNIGGVLDTNTIDVDNDDDCAEVSEAIWTAINNNDWVLAVGDTIKIAGEGS